MANLVGRFLFQSEEKYFFEARQPRDEMLFSIRRDMFYRRNACGVPKHNIGSRIFKGTLMFLHSDENVAKLYIYENYFF